MPAVLPGRSPGLEHPAVIDELLQERDRPRRCRHHHLRQITKSEPELQHVPGGLGISPFGDLVAPGGIELGAAQLVGLFRREDLGNRPVGPCQAALRGRKGGPPVLVMNGKQARDALDHHPACIIECGGDQRHVPGRLAGPLLAFDLGLHPFSSRPRLSGAPPTDDEPAMPGVPCRLGHLIIARPGRPGCVEVGTLIAAEALENVAPVRSGG